jgi:hypothetical protein
MASEPIPYSESDSSILQWDEVASELIAEMEQLPTDTYILPEDIDLENEKSIQVSADITENVEFNNEIINIENWKNYNIETKETLEPGYTIETTTNTPIYLLPIHKDLFVNQKEEILQMEIPSGQNFEIAEKVVLHGDSNEQITFGILANTFGSKIVASIVLDAKDKNEIKKEFASFRENAENTVTYIALPEDIYPNKIQNVIRSMAYISQYQELNGPFQKDKEYSYLDIIGLENPQLKREYAQGLTISKAVVRAGGVCAGATALSTLIHQHDGNNVKIVEQWSQPAEYFQGAFSPSEDLVDAIVDQSEKENHDFRWIQQDNLYIETDVTLIPVNKPLPDPLEKPSDNTLVLSLSFTRDLPENQSSHLLHTLDNYISYREQFLNSNNSEVLKSRVIAHEPNIKNHNAFSMLYNPEDLSIFEHEISQDPILQEILTLQEIVNSYSPDSEVSLSEYLKNTDWYTNTIQTRNKDAVDTALRMISYTQIDGQPLQCVGYVSMLSLIYPELNMINVGGAPIKIAKELIPQDAIEYSGNRVAIFPPKYTGGTIHTAKNIPISYYKRGDLFLTSNGYAGHIGVILDKTVKENGEVVLLVSDSNRSVDGKIKTFGVTEDNITEIFGIKRYILRKYEMDLSFIQEDITLSQLVKV